MTTVALVTCPKIFQNSKPPRGEPYFDPIRTLNNKMFSFEVVNDQYLMESRKRVKEQYDLYSYDRSNISTLNNKTSVLALSNDHLEYVSTIVQVTKVDLLTK